jgi:hypothetical protein
MGSPGVHSVEKPPVTLDNRHIRPKPRPSHRIQNGLLGHQEGIEVATGFTRRRTQPGGIDEVGTFLERGNLEVLRSERANQPQGHQGLAGIAGQPRNHHPG